MEELQEIVVKINENKNFVSDSSLNTVTTELAQRKMTFLTFVSELGLLITNEDTCLRRAGVELFVSILNGLPKNFLNGNEIGHITDFLCLRLQDHHSIIPVVLKGLSIVAHSETVPEGVPTKIFEAADLYFSCQSQQQPDRYLFYDIMFHLIKNSYEFQRVGVQFLSGMLNFISGECDPRNLLFLFQNLPYLFGYSDVNPMVDDAFESVSCYFPIDYVEKFDNPLVVTKKELSDGLMDCLTCVPSFANLTMELATDKLTTTLKSAKLDCLKLLEESIKKFPFQRWIENILPIMERVHDNISKDPDMEIWETAMNLYNTLLIVFDAMPDNLDKIYYTNIFIDNLYKAHENDLIGEKLEKTKYLQMFIDFSSKTPLSWKCVYGMLLYRLSVLDSFHMTYLVELLKSTHILSIGKDPTAKSCKVARTLEVWHETPKFLFYALNDERISVRIQGYHGLGYIMQLLNVEEITTLTDCLIDCFVNADNYFLKKAGYMCLKELAKKDIDAVRRIFDHESLSLKSGDPERMKNILEMHCALLNDTMVFEKFMNKLNHLMIDNDLQNLNLAFSCIKEYIDPREYSTTIRKMYEDHNLPLRLIEFWKLHCSSFGLEYLSEDKILLLPDIVYMVVTIITLLPDVDQKSILKYTFSMPSFSCYVQISATEDEQCYRVNTCSDIIMMEGIMCGLLPSAIGLYFTERTYKSFLNYLTLTEFPDERCRDSARLILASVFNKLSNSIIEECTEMVYGNIRKYKWDKGKTRLRRSSVVTAAYVTKGLLTRGYPNIRDRLDDLVSMACDKFYGSAGLEGFKVLISDDVKYCNEFYHCNIRLFYKQRLFVDTIFSLTQSVKEGSNATVRYNAIKVIHLQLSDINHSVLRSYFDRIIPILIESLSFPDDDVITSSLKTVRKLLMERESIMEDVVYTFISRLLAIAASSPKLTIRVLGLKCLQEYANYKIEVVLPYKAKVMYELKKTLDDKKRLVRKEAVEARCRWAILDTPVKAID